MGAETYCVYSILEGSTCYLCGNQLLYMLIYMYMYALFYYVFLMRLFPTHIGLFSTLLQTKLSEIESYQREADSALSQVGVVTSDSSHLEELLKRGEALEVFVPQVKALKMVSHRILSVLFNSDRRHTAISHMYIHTH